MGEGNLLIGPVFAREVAIAPRRPRLYIARTLFCLLLLFLMSTAWLVLTGTQLVRDLGDLARFGSALFQLLASLQLALAVFFAALLTASAVAQEKDRRTLVLLLLTNLSNSELVLGKLMASLLNVLVVLVAAVPLFMLCALFGGVSFDQIARVFAVTLASVLACGSLGSTLALWREKTFQALAMTVLALVLWLAVWAIVARGVLFESWLGLPCEVWAAGFSPWEAIVVATRPYVRPEPALGVLGTPVHLFLLVALGISVLLNGVAVAMVRVWNPSRESRAAHREEDTWRRESIWGAEYDAAQKIASQEGASQEVLGEEREIREQSAGVDTASAAGRIEERSTRRLTERSVRLRVVLALLVVGVLGFAAKLYPGPAQWWVNNWGPASVAYEVFFMLLVFLVVPRRGAITPIALAVCATTCALEFLQLWQPAWLQAFRSTPFGGSVLGTSFSWWDLPAYPVGCLLGWFVLRWLAGPDRLVDCDASGASDVTGASGARVRRAATGRKAPRTRHVWDNPIIWREMRTWAYGRKILIVRLAYLALFALAAGSVYWMVERGTFLEGGGGAGALVALFLLSLVLVNAQAVTSLTSERDGRALDLLLVSDLTPKEFVYGKLGGVFYNTKEMIVLPLLLCVYLWYAEAVGLEELIYLVLAALVLYGFVAMLGIHAGMAYDNSRSAIATSLGTVFFLFLGVATCMRIMLSFSGQFEAQLPFLGLIVFGGAGLFLALGARNPSTAIGVASFACPLVTFYAITSFFMSQGHLAFVAIVAAYGFTTIAMLIPAIDEFDVATGRTTIGEH
jgi:hypothetical protein